jgi:pyridoxine/pyridoxamine 5'-phosphate oxidase
MIAYESRLKWTAGRERRLHDRWDCEKDVKKRWNELKDLLQAKDLAVF